MLQKCFLAGIFAFLLMGIEGRGHAAESLAKQAASVGAETDSRLPTVMNLSGQWDFAYTTQHAGQAPAADVFRATMPAPGCWDDYLDRSGAKSIWPEARFNPAPVMKYPMEKYPKVGILPDAALPYLLGTGWYRKQIDIPADWKGRQITLRVGRVVTQAWVYVNGQQVYHHAGYSTPWEIPVGGALKAGQANELIIAVDNTSTNLLGCMIRGYKGRSGGIFGAVTLQVAGVASLADLYVWSEKEDRLRWRVELQGKTLPAAELRWTVFDRHTKKSMGEGRLAVSGSEVEWTTGLVGMRPWSDREPHLYEIEVGLWLDGTCLDARRQNFGLRRLKNNGFSLRLNDKPIFLRGICEISYYPATCTPPLDVQWYRRHIQHMKEVGFNWLRFHTSVPPESYLQAADELGMLIQVEAPLGYERAQWLEILKFCRTHPSVVIYCCGNEEVLDEGKIQFLRQCAADLRELVPDALFNPQEALHGVEYGTKKQFGTGLVEKPYPHNPERLEKLKEFSDVFGQYAWGTLSYRSLTGDPQMLDERLRVYNRPCLSHEVGILGCYLNLDLEQRYAGTRIGPGLFANIRQNLERVGLLDRAGLYYRNSCAWQRALCKEVVETVRKTGRIAGYDMLGANDSHWHQYGYGCGVLNEFDELKPGDSVANILSYNGESVLLMDGSPKRNLRTGEKFAVDLLVSWFGADTLRNATVRWELKSADGATLGAGEQMVQPVEPGSVEKLMTVGCTLSDLERPTKTTLEVCLSGPDCVLNNRWAFWVFPPPPAPNNADIKIISELTAKDLEYLMRGGRVVLFGHKPWPARKIGFQMAIAGRPHGNLATVIADHPLMKRFPHDGYCDWQFRPMMDGATTIVFDDMAEAFDPIVEVVSTYKTISRQASLFEWRVGKGRLLICTLNLPTSDPGTQYLRACILDYAGGNQFEPRTRVTPEQIARRLDVALPTLEKQHETDEAFDPRGQKKLDLQQPVQPGEGNSAK